VKPERPNRCVICGATGLPDNELACPNCYTPEPRPMSVWLRERIAHEVRERAAYPYNLGLHRMAITADILGVSIEELLESRDRLAKQRATVQQIVRGMVTEDVLDLLTPNQREVIEMRLDRCTLEEIGEDLGISHQSVSERIRWARKRIAKALTLQND
jgi:RNA polymerase sigma factor (sigma-70 family)